MSQSEKTVKQICRYLFTTKIVSIVDSEARDNLSNERTFLAWMRTGFAVTAVGIVISRIGATENGDTLTKVLSLLYILLGLLCIVVGAIRFIHVQMLLEDKGYPISGLTITIVMLLGVATFVATIVLLL